MYLLSNLIEKSPVYQVASPYHLCEFSQYPLVLLNGLDLNSGGRLHRLGEEEDDQTPRLEVLAVPVENVLRRLHHQVVTADLEQKKIVNEE